MTIPRQHCATPCLRCRCQIVREVEPAYTTDQWKCSECGLDRPEYSDPVSAAMKARLEAEAFDREKRERLTRLMRHRAVN